MMDRKFGKGVFVLIFVLVVIVFVVMIFGMVLVYVFNNVWIEGN